MELVGAAVFGESAVEVSGDITQPARELLSLLQEQLAFPLAERRWELRETHLSLVLLGESLVLKLKKTLKLPFVDHRRLEARWRSVAAELQLNRRLTEGIYLGVLPLIAGRVTPFREDSLEQVHPDQPPPADLIEPVLVMRRLPRDSSLDRMLVRGAVTAEEIERVAARLADFHLSQRGVPGGEHDDFEAQLTENFKVLAALLPEGACRRAAESLWPQAASSAAALFRVRRERARSGLVIDGHGDLRSEHISIAEQTIQIFDCIEFSTALRTVDVLNDIAFLAMDLDYHDRPDLAQRLVAAYEERYSASRHDALLSLFKAYRALVRAKVEAIQASQHPENADGATRYVGLACRYLRKLEAPFALVLSGQMGIGKSTLAEELHARTAAGVLQSDAIRRELYGKSTEGAGFGEGSYTRSHTEAVYQELFRRAELALAAGAPVILDASFIEAHFRRQAAALCRAQRAEHLLVSCTLSREAAFARLEQRARAGSSISEGRRELFDEQAKRIEPLGAEEARDAVVLNLSDPPDALAAVVLAQLAERIAAGGRATNDGL